MVYVPKRMGLSDLVTARAIITFGFRNAQIEHVGLRCKNYTPVAAIFTYMKNVDGNYANMYITQDLGNFYVSDQAETYDALVAKGYEEYLNEDRIAALIGDNTECFYEGGEITMEFPRPSMDEEGRFYLLEKLAEFYKAVCYANCYGHAAQLLKPRNPQSND